MILDLSQCKIYRERLPRYIRIEPGIHKIYQVHKSELNKPWYLRHKWRRHAKQRKELARLRKELGVRQKMVCTTKQWVLPLGFDPITRPPGAFIRGDYCKINT